MSLKIVREIRSLPTNRLQGNLPKNVAGVLKKKREVFRHYLVHIENGSGQPERDKNRISKKKKTKSPFSRKVISESKKNSYGDVGFIYFKQRTYSLIYSNKFNIFNEKNNLKIVSRIFLVMYRFSYLKIHLK